MNEQTNDPDGLLRGGKTTVVWVPHLNDPTRPTAEEIAAGTVIGTVSGPLDLPITRDEVASIDPRTLLEGRVARFRVERHSLDPAHELVQITGLGEEGAAYVRGECLHSGAEPVTTLDGELVGHLCLGCETLLPSEWRP